MTLAAASEAARRALWSAVSGLLLGVTLTQGALAHAPPEVYRVEPQQGGGPQLALLTNRGFLVGDGAGSWRLMCNVALGINSSERPDYQLRADGRLMVATSVGLSVSDDGGCNWQRHGQFDGIATTAMTWHAAQPEQLWLAIRLEDAPNAIYASADGGDVWRELASLDEGVGFDTLRTAAGDPERLYASGLVIDPATMSFRYLIGVSRDSGTSWTQQLVDMEQDEGALELLAVSPTDADLLVLRAQGNAAGQPDRLVISADAGQTTTRGAEVLALQAAAFSADGTRLWLASQEGLQVSTDRGQTLAPVAGPADLTCVQLHGGELLVCGLFEGDVLGGAGVGVSANADAPFTAWMTFDQVDDPPGCEPCSTTGLACGEWWADWQREILNVEQAPPPVPACGVDAGPVPSAQADAATGMEHRQADSGTAGAQAVNGSCGCRAMGAETSASWGCVGLTLVALSLRRRRRRGGGPDGHRTGTRRSRPLGEPSVL